MVIHLRNARFLCSSGLRRIHLLISLIGLLVPISAFAQSGNIGACPSGIPIQDFYIGTSGDVTDSGRTKEGPVCVRVHYNRLRFNLALNFQTTQAKGVDLSSVLLTGSAPSAATGATGVTDPRVARLNDILTALTQLDRNAGKVDMGVKNISALVALVDAATAPGKAFPEGPLKDSYKDLKPALLLAQTLQYQALPTDLVTGVCPATPPATPATGSVLAILLGYQADSNFYTANQANMDSALGLANHYRCGTPDITNLTTNIAILKFWDNRFRELGLRTEISDAQLAQLSLVDFFVNSTQLNCGNIFNRSSSTSASATVYDESQTLSGNMATPSAHQNQNFFTLTCASPFSVSAGVEFSTIPAKEFAIIKSAGGANNTTINKFGLTSDSSFHPLPVALVHVRLWESKDQRFAFHASAGASGNIQGQNSGGSSAEFIMGPSLSFFRTMFLTAGLHVGTKTALAGGFNVGDTVPSDITSPQVTKSYTTGFGIAITFTKP